jgi:hypothetical protein
MLRFVIILFLMLLLASCSLSKYGHYPKGEKNNEKKTVLKRKNIVFNKQPYSIEPLKFAKSAFVVVVPKPYLEADISFKNTPKELLLPPGDGKPKDATKTNKKAKLAFTSSIVALGSLAAGIIISPIFLLVMLLFAVVAFIYSIIALKQIKRTGEYGRAKAEFALYSSIPILVLSIVGLLAYLMSNGTGLQIGNFVIN